MARKSLIHRDLKPENILLHSRSKGNFDIRIADFGFALDLSKPTECANSQTYICGTPGYMAPEAALGRGYSLKSDIFSIGSIFYSILTLRNLFPGKDHDTIMK